MVDLIEKAVADGLPDMALMDCHSPGLDSVVLRHAGDSGGKTFMQRVFIAHHDRHNLDKLFGGRFTEQHVLAPHNHRYPLTIQPLVGIFVNHEITLHDERLPTEQPRGEWRGEWYHSAQSTQGPGNIFEFSFVSGINGTMELNLKCSRKVKDINNRYMVPGDQVAMRSEDVHTVLVPKKPHMPPITAWLVTEYKDERDSLFYSQVKNPEIDMKGLYEYLLPSEAELLLENVLKWMPRDTH